MKPAATVVRLGPRHRFSVNTQALDLTLLPRGDTLAIHLTGTDFLETLHDPELDALKPFWPVTLDSESPTLYRGEYLAGSLLLAARRGAMASIWLRCSTTSPTRKRWISVCVRSPHHAIAKATSVASMTTMRH